MLPSCHEYYERDKVLHMLMAARCSEISSDNTRSIQDIVNVQNVHTYPRVSTWHVQDYSSLNCGEQKRKCSLSKKPCLEILTPAFAYNMEKS